MNSEDYNPKPIDTNDVSIPEELLPLIEEMSKNTHEVWAQGRMNTGWTYGEQRNDELKHHPCLIPYDELPESEKKYDRETTINAIKLILKLGFKIEKK